MGNLRRASIACMTNRVSTPATAIETIQGYERPRKK
jgi:hypothetical protein